jgi:hypothetical protein
LRQPGVEVNLSHTRLAFSFDFVVSPHILYGVLTILGITVFGQQEVHSWR